MKKTSCLILAAILLVSLLVAAPMSLKAQASREYTIQELLKELPLRDVGSAYYSHALLLQDSNTLSPEMAKASVVLSQAAYTQSSVNSLLGTMDFSVYDNSASYTRKLTINDCDHVAYTIGYKELVHPYTGETYMLYAVPIRGTPKNAEWFSDFDVGDGTEHEGFRNAADEVYDDLKSRFQTDGVDKNHRIVWLTGHSRGAACANLIAGWLSESSSYTVQDQVFAYTFACPTVGTFADTSLENIYNFNNDGDVVTKFPLKEWSFERNGQDITLDNSDLYFNNLKMQYQRVNGTAYAGQRYGDNYDTLLTEILGYNRDNYTDSPKIQLVMALGAWVMGGKNDAGFLDVAGKYLSDNAFTIIKNWVASKISSMTQLDDIYNTLNDVLTSRDDLADWAEQAYYDTMWLDEDEYKDFVSNNRSKISKLESESGVGIENSSSFWTARNRLVNNNSSIESLADCVGATLDLFCDSNGNVLSAVTHAHECGTYVMWINAVFYGQDGWRGNNEITEVTIDGNHLSVGKNAFYNCDGLTAVEILDNTIVSKYAFYDCDGMETLVLSDNTTRLGLYSFAYCDELREVTIPVDYISIYAPFYRTSGVTKIHFTKGNSGVMPDYNYYSYDHESDACECCKGTYSSWNDSITRSLQYQSLKSLKTVDFEDGITHIGNYAFYTPDSRALTQVTMPTTLETIGKSAFYNCTKLSTSMQLEKLTSLGERCFYNCQVLPAFSFSKFLTEIPDYCFYNCDSLTAVEIPSNITAVGKEAFYNSDGMETLVLSDNTTHLGHYAFAYCDGLREVTMPVDCISIYAPFYRTAGVTTIHFTNGNSGVMPDYNYYSYGHETDECQCCKGTYSTWNDSITRTLQYQSLKSLKTVNFEEGVTHIGNYAFYGGTALAQVTLPTTLKSIGSYTFYNCKEIPNITLPAGLESIGACCFENCVALQAIKLPGALTAISNYCFKNCDTLKAVAIPANITTIGTEAFYDCDGMETLVLSDNTTHLGHYAFAYCDGLREVTMPVDYISIYAPFYRTSGVTTIHFTKGNSGVMPDYNYYSYGHETDECQCCKGTYSTWNDSITRTLQYQSLKSLKTVNFEEGVTHIGNYAFYGGTALAQVTMPTTLKSIGKSAFYNCKNLSNVYYDGLRKQWDQITIDSNNAPLTNATLHTTDYVVGIAVKTMPAKIQFVTGESLDMTGFVLAATYSDDIVREVTEGFTVSGFDTSVLGSQVLTVTYQGFTATVPVMIVLPLGSQEITAGFTAQFSVEAADAASYKWQYRRNPSAPWVSTTLGGYKTDTLSVPAILARNGYQYRCRITGTDGEVYYTETATLTVLDSITVTAQPARQIVNVNAVATFAVEAEGAGLSYQWQYRKHEEDSWKVTGMTGNKTNTLSVPALLARNGYQYKCVITDENGIKINSKAATLSAIGFTSHPEDQTAFVNADAVFSVTAQGQSLTYQWQYRKSETGSWMNTSLSGFDTDTLTVLATSSRNGYQYRCKITDAQGIIRYSEEATLTVE